MSVNSYELQVHLISSRFAHPECLLSLQTLTIQELFLKVS